MPFSPLGYRPINDFFSQDVVEESGSKHHGAESRDFSISQISGPMPDCDLSVLVFHHSFLQNLLWRQFNLLGYILFYDRWSLCCICSPYFLIDFCFNYVNII